MEASERPQLPLDDDRPTATVRALDDRLVIERADRRRRARRARRPRARRGRPARRPTRSRRRSRSAPGCSTARTRRSSVDYVRAEFERHASELRERLSKALEAGDAAARRADRRRPSTATRNDSVQKQIGEIIATGARASSARRCSKQFSAEEGSNPLFDFKARWSRPIKELDERQQAEGEENRARRIERELQRAGGRAHASTTRRRRAGSPRPRPSAGPQGLQLRGARPRDARARSRQAHGDAASTPAASTPSEAAARRATRWSSSAPPTAPRWRPDRVRGQGQAAFRRTTPGPSSTRHGRARRRSSRCSSSPARTRSRPASSS